MLEEVGAFYGDTVGAVVSVVSCGSAACRWNSEPTGNDGIVNDTVRDDRACVVNEIVCNVLIAALQLYQTLLHSLLELATIWKKGDSAFEGYSKTISHQTQALMADICLQIGENVDTQKYHDLGHVPTDMVNCGGSIGCSTGPCDNVTQVH